MIFYIIGAKTRCANYFLNKGVTIECLYLFFKNKGIDILCNYYIAKQKI